MFNAWHHLLPAWLLVGGTVILMLIAAWLIHRYVEKPVQNWLKRALRAESTKSKQAQAIAAE